MGVEIKCFTMCIAFRKVLFFIYKEFHLSDRVPISRGINKSSITSQPCKDEHF